MRISETNVGPFKAKEKRYQCPHCEGLVFVKIAWDATPEQTHRHTAAALDEHRRLCTQAPSEAARIYRIDYPR